MSSDSESKVVAAGRYRVKEEGEMRSSVWEHFQEKDDTYIVTVNLKTTYANTTGLLRHLKHMHPNISTCTRKETESI